MWNTSALDIMTVHVSCWLNKLISIRGGAFQVLCLMYFIKNLDGLFYSLICVITFKINIKKKLIKGFCVDMLLLLQMSYTFPCKKVCIYAVLWLFFSWKIWKLTIIAV